MELTAFYLQSRKLFAQVAVPLAQALEVTLPAFDFERLDLEVVLERVQAQLFLFTPAIRTLELLPQRYGFLLEFFALLAPLFNPAGKECQTGGELFTALMQLLETLAAPLLTFTNARNLDPE